MPYNPTRHHVFCGDTCRIQALRDLEHLQQRATALAASLEGLPPRSRLAVQIRQELHQVAWLLSAYAGVDRSPSQQLTALLDRT